MSVSKKIGIVIVTGIVGLGGLHLAERRRHLEYARMIREIECNGARRSGEGIEGFAVAPGGEMLPV